VAQGCDGAQKLIANANQPTYDAKLLRLFELADQNGVGAEFRFVFDRSAPYGFYPRLYKWSIMYTPPQNKSRVLLWARVQPRRGKFHLYIASSAFAEFYPVSKFDAVRILGSNHHYALNLDDLNMVFGTLDQLFRLIEKNKA
jgi:hypothetical protein